MKEFLIFYVFYDFAHFSDFVFKQKGNFHIALIRRSARRSDFSQLQPPGPICSCLDGESPETVGLVIRPEGHSIPPFHHHGSSIVGDIAHPSVTRTTRAAVETAWAATTEAIQVDRRGAFHPHPI